MDITSTGSPASFGPFLPQEVTLPAGNRGLKRLNEWPAVVDSFFLIEVYNKHVFVEITKNTGFQRKTNHKMIEEHPLEQNTPTHTNTHQQKQTGHKHVLLRACLCVNFPWEFAL